MRLASHTVPRADNRGSCCSYEDFEDARRVAERMDFPFYVIDLRDEFAARVITPFVGEYLAWQNAQSMPDVQSRHQVRPAVASGQRSERGLRRHRPLRAHRARCGWRVFHLLRAARPAQGPVLFSVHADRASFRAPFFRSATMTKDQVRARARELGLANADKPESQEICFVPDGDYAAFVGRAQPSGANPSRRRGRCRGTAVGATSGNPSFYRRAAARAGSGRRRTAVRPRDPPRNWSGDGRAPRSNRRQAGYARPGSAWWTRLWHSVRRDGSRGQDPLSPSCRSRGFEDDRGRSRRGRLRARKSGRYARPGLRVLSRRRGFGRRDNRKRDGKLKTHAVRYHHLGLQGQPVRLGDDRKPLGRGRPGTLRLRRSGRRLRSQYLHRDGSRRRGKSEAGAPGAPPEPQRAHNHDRMPGAGQSRKTGRGTGG